MNSAITFGQATLLAIFPCQVGHRLDSTIGQGYRLDSAITTHQVEFQAVPPDWMVLLAAIPFEVELQVGLHSWKVLRLCSEVRWAYRLCHNAGQGCRLGFVIR